MFKHKHTLLFILGAALLICGGFKLHQTGHEYKVLAEKNAQLQIQLQESERLMEQRYQTLAYTLTGRGTTMPVLSASGLAAERFEAAWSVLNAKGLANTGADIVQAEQETGVNGLVLAAIAYLESGGGSSKLALTKNNLFGLGAVDDNPYYYALSFNSKEESIYYAAELLSESYLSSQGQYYHGDDLRAIGKRYASDPLWADKVNHCMIMIVRSLLEAQIQEADHEV